MSDRCLQPFTISLRIILPIDILECNKYSISGSYSIIKRWCSMIMLTKKHCVCMLCQLCDFHVSMTCSDSDVNREFDYLCFKLSTCKRCLHWSSHSCKRICTIQNLIFSFSNKCFSAVLHSFGNCSKYYSAVCIDQYFIAIFHSAYF